VHTIIHVVIPKQDIIAWIRRDGAHRVFEGCTGTDESVLEALRNDTREVIPLGSCVNADARGYCRGCPIKSNALHEETIR